MTRPATAQHPTTRRTAHAAQPANNRSRITNGKALLDGVSACSTKGRRYRDVIDGLSADLGSDPSLADQLQIRSIAALIVHAEALTADMLNGKPVDSEQLTRVSNSAARMLSALRKKAAPKRRAGAGANALREYLASKAEAAQ
jgi:hypothetical protein